MIKRNKTIGGGTTDKIVSYNILRNKMGFFLRQSPLFSPSYSHTLFLSSSIIPLPLFSPSLSLSSMKVC